DASQHLDRAEAFLDAFDGTGARLPSQRRYEARERSLVEGVRIPAALHADLLALLDRAPGAAPAGRAVEMAAARAAAVSPRAARRRRPALPNSRRRARCAPASPRH